jgi:hypothetical protein
LCASNVKNSSQPINDAHYNEIDKKALRFQPWDELSIGLNRIILVLSKPLMKARKSCPKLYA